MRSARDRAGSYPNARLLLAPRSGHLIHVEEPDLLFGAVETFLAGKRPAESQ